MHTYGRLMVALLVVGLAGCAGVLDGPPRDERADGERESAAGRDEAEGAGAQSRGAEIDSGFRGHPLDDPDSLLSTRVVYFEYDSSELADDQRDILKAHARFLGDHPETQVVLEGHTDERGSREYNLALGESRAKSVMQYLNLQGVSNEQMEAMSFGEERPAQTGNDESAWEQNRRVEILYSSY